MTWRVAECTSETRPTDSGTPSCEPVAEHPGGCRQRDGGNGRQRPQVGQQQAEPGSFEIHPLYNGDGVHLLYVST
jgi:hypothetical protein